MSVVYPRSCLLQETVIDMAELERTALGLVQEVIRRTRLSGADSRIFRLDMVQEALSRLFEFVVVKGHDWQYAYGAARHYLYRFVTEIINWRQAGFALQASRKYQVYDNLTEPGDHDGDDERYQGTRLPMRLYDRRPTEDAVILGEKRAEQAQLWTAFEREAVRILAAMRTQQHPSSLQRAAAILCESAKGVSRAGIALKLNMDKEIIDGVLKHYRERVQEYLEQSPVMQGLIRAEGQLRVLWWDEVTEKVINTGQKFVVIYPHGAFAIHFKKANGRLYGKVVAAKSVNGRFKCREVSIGRVGHITPDSLFKGTRTLQIRMSALTA
ncbi:MAG: hypothetical protein KC421_25300 [Anaerolineales bacterium]|nr:hypothetical protein [Anaerolineales bacterium]